MPDGKWVSKANLQTFWQMIRSKVIPTMIGDTVTTWLTEHVDPVGSAVVVDDTLTIQGAAADAKKTGDEISGLKEELVHSNAGHETFALYANFVNGTQENGNYNHWYKFRVTCTSILSFDRDLVLTIENGFRILLALYTDGQYTSDTRWVTETYTIPRNTTFKIVIGRVTEDSSETANISEFVNAVVFDTVENMRTQNIDIINRNLPVISEQAKLLYSIVGKDSYYITEIKNLKTVITSGATWQNNTYIEFKGLNVSEKKSITILVDGRSVENVTASNSYGECRFKDANDTMLKTEYIRFSSSGVDISDGSCNITYTVPTGAVSADVIIYGVSNYTPTIGNKLYIYGACVIVGTVKLYPVNALDTKTNSMMLAEVSTMLQNQKETDLTGKFFGYVSQDYIAQTTSENWQTKSYTYINNIDVNGYRYAYAIIMSRKGLGLRSGIVTWFDDNGDAINTDWMTELESFDGGSVIAEYIIPTNATKMSAEFDGISNAQRAGQESVIGETYYVRGCYVYVTNDKLSVTSDTDSLNAEWKNAVKQIRAEQGTDLCFGIQTDTHFFTGASNIIGNQLKDATKYVGFDFVANLGDITRGYTGGNNNDTPDNMREYAEIIMKRYTDGIRCPFITCIGNHEKNNMYADEHDVDPFSLAELYAQFTKQSLNTSDKYVAPVGKSYYYIDLSGVRVIALFTNDSDIGSFTVSTEQAEWFRTEALNTTLPILVLAHVPLVNGWSPDNLNYSSDYERIMTPLEAFKNNGGTVIACIYGHAHRQEAQKKNGIWHIICTRSETQYTTAEFFMVNLNTYDIKTIGVGNAESRSFTH